MGSRDGQDEQDSAGYGCRVTGVRDRHRDFKRRWTEINADGGSDGETGMGRMRGFGRLRVSGYRCQATGTGISTADGRGLTADKLEWYIDAQSTRTSPLPPSTWSGSSAIVE